MKKAKLEALIHSQAKEIARLNKQVSYLKNKFNEVKDFVMSSLVEIIGGGK